MKEFGLNWDKIHTLILIGGMGSAGKSTFAKKLCKELCNRSLDFNLCSYDKIAEQLNNNEYNIVRPLLCEDIKKSIITHKITVVDWALDSRCGRSDFLSEICSTYEPDCIDLKNVFLNTSFNKIIERTYLRGVQFIDEIKYNRLFKVHSSLQIPTLQELEQFKFNSCENYVINGDLDISNLEVNYLIPSFEVSMQNSEYLFKIDEEAAIYVEGFLYDKIALQELLTRMSSSSFDVDEDIKQFYYNKYIETNRAYCMAKNELFNNIIKPYVKVHFNIKGDFDWKLNFSTSEVTVYGK